jgi:hypothetical protein
MNTTFKNEGTLREVLLKDFSITHGDMNEYNIELTINFKKQNTKILCSKPLSDIIRNEKILPENILDYEFVTVTDNYGSYTRLSQCRTVEGDVDLGIMENMEKLKDTTGSVCVVFKLDDMEDEPYSPYKSALSDYVAF